MIVVVACSSILRVRKQSNSGSGSVFSILAAEHFWVELLSWSLGIWMLILDSDGFRSRVSGISVPRHLGDSLKVR